MTFQLSKVTIAVLLLTIFSIGQALAGQISVSVKNLTNGIYFTPLLITAHDGNTHLFNTGESASGALQAMAEGGDISGLITLLGGTDKDTVENPAGGLLAPGESVSNVFLNTRRTRNKYLSIVAMMLPTNDGFVGLNSQRIPFFPGTYKYYLFGYDAGTEANDELVTGGGMPGEKGIPAAPGGDAGKDGTGVTDIESNNLVHVHRGVIGDDDPEGGKSDLDRTIHRWLNPVAEVTIEVHHRRYGRH